jgi:hypothetical protein
MSGRGREQKALSNGERKENLEEEKLTRGSGGVYG